MKFNLYANCLQHKRTLHDTAAPATGAAIPGASATAPMAAVCGVEAPVTARAPVAVAPATTGTPATAGDAASGALGVPSYDTPGVNDGAADDGLSLGVPANTHAMPAAFPITVCTASTAVANRIAAYYRAEGDIGRTKLYVPLNKRDRPSDFVTREHKDMRFFALSSGGCGLSRKAKAEYYETTLYVERAAMRMVASAAALRKKRKKGKNGKGKPPKLDVKIGPLESAFPTAASFVRSLEGGKWRCLAELEWRETSIPVRGNVYKFYSRSIMSVATNALTTAVKVCLRGKRKIDEHGNVLRTNSLDSDIYIQEQTDVDRLHSGKKDGGKDIPTFTLAVQLFSDAALVSWNGSKYGTLRSTTAPLLLPACSSFCCVPCAWFLVTTSLVGRLGVWHVLSHTNCRSSF